MTAATKFDPEHIHRHYDARETAEIKEVLRAFASSDTAYAEVLADYTNLEEAFLGGLHNLTDSLAFSRPARLMAPWKWAKTYLAWLPAICGPAVRLNAIPPLASPCEHSWSTEG